MPAGSLLKMASTDRDALNDLFEATGGAGWATNLNWGTNAPLSEWHGVEVNKKGRVVKLVLDSNCLEGTRELVLGACPNNHPCCVVKMWQRIIVGSSVHPNTHTGVVFGGRCLLFGGLENYSSLSSADCFVSTTFEGF